MKARIKDARDFPEYIKCCPDAIIAMAPFHGSIIEIDIKNTTTKVRPCPFCGTRFKTNLFLLPNNVVIPTDCVDIDEGEAN